MDLKTSIHTKDKNHSKNLLWTESLPDKTLINSGQNHSMTKSPLYVNADKIASGIFSPWDSVQEKFCLRGLLSTFLKIEILSKGEFVQIPKDNLVSI